MLLEITDTLRLQIEHIESVMEIAPIPVKAGVDIQSKIHITMRSGDTIDLPGWTMKQWDTHIAKMIKLIQLSQSPQMR